MFTEKIASLWDQLKVVFSDFAFTDFLDICLVAFILYSVIKLIRETKAIQLAKGLLLFGVAYLARIRRQTQHNKAQSFRRAR